jgi:cyclic beta-1,2-glucan synthetase
MRQAVGDLTTAGPFADGGMELLGIEPLEEHARRLAALLTVTIRGRVSGAPHLRRLDGHMRALRDVYVALTEDARRGEQPSPAAEWLLDNFHIISAAARDIRHDLPPAFYRRLPRIAADEFAGLPRVYAMALELIGRSAGRLDSQRLHRFVTAFQSITPLTMGELWAWPSALKLALLDYLRARADLLAESRAHQLEADRLAASLEDPAGRRTWPHEVHPAFVIRLLQRSREREPAAGVLRQELDAALAARSQTIEEAIRADGRHQASEQAFMSSLVGTLRLISTFDWTEFFERVSLVEQVLHRDPVGVYGSMDFQSRDRYRHAVEEMARPQGRRACETGRRTHARGAQRARRVLPDRRRPQAIRERHRLEPAARDPRPTAVLPARDIGLPRHDRLRHHRAGGHRAGLRVRAGVARGDARVGGGAHGRAGQRAHDSDPSADHQQPHPATQAAATRSLRGPG